MPEISKTADQALVLLLSMAEAGPGTAAGLAERLGMHRTVVHRLLATLEGRGFVRRQGSSYALGLVLRHLAEQVESDLLTAARPVMTELSAATGETVTLHVREGEEIVVADRVQGSRHPVRVDYQPGDRNPLSVGAAGRAVLAHLAAEAPAPLIERLEEIRRTGHDYSHDELKAGVSGIAAPVFSRTGVVASLSLVVPTSRDESLAEHVPELIEAAGAVTSRLAAM
ncbi:IclR family transcriptional regulator [Actinomadura barringtoniae]|uniref:IclR family transcriptional regulator n=1 Tax=Actinomadura barringtoniae TaxID=1427535 RepID=A0A939PGK9_9ACTN|nr:IclR family transcriptional regulator [Actinomadura barringtoniae]MBO2449703.1 IclR family transcriptional regulator [Actinomadura barringtoniae]